MKRETILLISCLILGWSFSARVWAESGAYGEAVGTDLAGKQVKIDVRDFVYYMAGTQTRFSGTEVWEHEGRRYQNAYRDGIRHGPFVCWFKDGSKHYEGYDEFGKRHGHYREWDESGVLRLDIVYYRGREIINTFWTNDYTTTQTYYDSGKLRSRIEYSDREILGKLRRWDEAGNEITEKAELMTGANHGQP
jgi:antitoxin component YwqK of YwqJK toxin-antitoxin module